MARFFSSRAINQYSTLHASFYSSLNSSVIPFSGPQPISPDSVAILVVEVTSHTVSICTMIFFILYVIAKTIWHDCGMKRVVYTKVLKKSFDSHQVQHFLQLNIRLLLYLNISQLCNNLAYSISSITEFLAYVTEDPSYRVQNVSWLCYSQAISVQFLDWSVSLWAFSVAAWLFVSVVLNRDFQNEKSRCGCLLLQINTTVKLNFEIFAFIAWFFIAMLFTLLPMIPVITYGATGSGWCWISQSVEPYGEYYGFFYLYFPTFILITGMVILYASSTISVFRTFNKVRDFYASNSNITSSRPFLNLNQLKKELKTYSKLVLYPFIFIASWIFPSIMRVLEFFSQLPTIIIIFSILAINLYGFFNVVVFFLDPFEHMDKFKALTLVILKWINKYFCCCCKRKSRDSDEKEDSLSQFGGFTSYLSESEFEIPKRKRGLMYTLHSIENEEEKRDSVSSSSNLLPHSNSPSHEIAATETSINLISQQEEPTTQYQTLSE